LFERNDLAVYAIGRKHALHTVYWLLRCLFGVRNEKALIPRLYHKLLAWQIDSDSSVLNRVERFFDRLFAKSLVIYLRKATPPTI
jgi:hypothetical protein